MSKRSASGASGPPAKRTTLNSYFESTSTPTLPSPIVSSAPVTDRQSTFVAHACPIQHQSQAVVFHNHVRTLRTDMHPVDCDHEMLAWRTMSLKVGRTGLSGEDDWTVKTGGDDDGEKGGSREIHNAIQAQAAVDVAVVVSRLYGGVMLGPARFKHINDVAQEALLRLSSAQAIPPLVERLNDLDAEIEGYAAPDSSSKKPAVRNDYETMPLDKLERLVVAREKRLELLKKRSQLEEEQLWNEVEKQESAPQARANSRSPSIEIVERDTAAESDEISSKNVPETEEDEEEAALWASFEAQDPIPRSQGPTAVDLGLPDEEDAAIAAATLQVDRKKREKLGELESIQPGLGGGFIVEND